MKLTNISEETGVKYQYESFMVYKDIQNKNVNNFFFLSNGSNINTQPSNID